MRGRIFPMSRDHLLFMLSAAVEDLPIPLGLNSGETSRIQGDTRINSETRNRLAMAEFYKAKFLFVTHGKQQMDPTVIQGSLRMTGTYKLKE